MLGVRTGEFWLEKRFAMASAHLVDQRLTSREGDGAEVENDPPAIPAKGMPAMSDYLAPDGVFGALEEPKAVQDFTADGPKTPDAREVSTKLMARDGEAAKAEGMNVLAAAWIQFQTHGWFGSDGGDELDVEAPDNGLNDPGPGRCRARRRAPDRARASGRGSSAGRNRMKRRLKSLRERRRRWWDASQVYGRGRKEADALRTWQGGKLKIDDNGLLPLDPHKGVDSTGSNDNWWVGLSALHHLFVKEHNYICEQLAMRQPDFDDAKLYRAGRLCISALMAKIHMEWKAAMRPRKGHGGGPPPNWRKAIGEGDTVSEKTSRDGVPYTWPDEFASVYRLHPLMLDYYNMRSHEDDHILATKDLVEVSGKRVRDVLNGVGMANAIYSMGTEPPGAPRLHNCPKFLRDLRRDNGEVQDMVAVDISLDRQHGVPRYNDFRELVGLSRAPTFADVTPNVAWQRELKDLYGDVDSVDLMAGVLAESPPEGSALSETAFRLLNTMEPGRLRVPEVHTEWGGQHVDQTGMVDLLLRHHPELRRSLETVENAFGPWKRVG